MRSRDLTRILRFCRQVQHKIMTRGLTPLRPTAISAAIRSSALIPRLAGTALAPAADSAVQAPRFIVIEGPMRAGKSTLAKILADSCAG